jgi:hypothetical protein
MAKRPQQTDSNRYRSRQTSHHRLPTHILAAAGYSPSLRRAREKPGCHLCSPSLHCSWWELSRDGCLQGEHLEQGGGRWMGGSKCIHLWRKHRQ